MSKPQPEPRESVLDRWTRVRTALSQLHENFSTMCGVAREWWEVLEESVEETVEWSAEGRIAYESGSDTIRAFEALTGRSMAPKKVLRIREPRDPRVAEFGRTLDEWCTRAFKSTHALLESLAGLLATADRAPAAVDVDRRASRIARDAMDLIDDGRPNLRGGTVDEIVRVSKQFAELLRSEDALALMSEAGDVLRVIASVCEHARRSESADPVEVATAAEVRAAERVRVLLDSLPDQKSLPESHRDVLTVLAAQPKGVGLTSSEIAFEVKKLGGRKIPVKTITDSVIPRLKLHFTITNARGGSGYVLGGARKVRGRSTKRPRR